MNTGNEELFSVLALEERLPDFTLLSKIIAEFYGLNSNDSGRRARHSWGFLGERLASEQAQLLIRKCESYGIKAAKVASGKLPKATPLIITKAGFEAETLTFTDSTGRSGAAPGADVSVLAAAPVKEETITTTKTTEGSGAGEKALRMGITLATGIPVGMGKRKQVIKETTHTETAFYLDAVLRPGKVRLRIAADHFDYSCLGAKKTYSSQMNFRLLARELALGSPGALKNTGLLAILEGKSLDALPYDSMEDFEKETLRLSAAALMKSE